MKVHDDLGREVPDPVPMEIPAGFRRPESSTEQIQRIIRQSLSQAAAAAGTETFEEANDFDMDDEDVEPVTDHEYRAMTVEIPAEDRELFEKWRRENGRSKKGSKGAAEQEGEGTSSSGGEGDGGEEEEVESA